jgi:C-terminal processing protease CtpA/Prc
MRWIPIATVVLVLTSCGGDGPSWRDLGGQCATPRTGIDPFTNRAYPDRQGTLDDEKKWLRAWTDDLYLWYDEVPALDPTAYPTATGYFNDLKTRAVTSSGKLKDHFHFWYPTDYWENRSTSGTDVGYGTTLTAIPPCSTCDPTRPPREYRVGYNEPSSPAALAGMNRGARILWVDDVDLVNASDPASLRILNAGLFPAKPSEPHKFVFEDFGTNVQHTVTLTSASVTTAPVPDVHTITVGSDKVGYMLFNDHLASAEKALVDGINLLKAEGVKDLILDIRYNGGGYLAIASELAYMIAGPNATSGKIFERLTFNSKHPSTDPVTGRALAPTPFYPTALGLSVAPGAPLPSLNLSRVFVLTGGGTCSASESILNGLQGVKIPVIQIGRTTCGKPYGFYPFDNCGTTYFSIQFKGVNAKGFGDYSDGFTPGAATAGSLAGCDVADDFAHALGDLAEGRLAAALAYRDSPTCPAQPTRALRAALPQEGVVLKSPWRQNRILQP